MTQFAHSDLLDNGLNYLANNCDKIALISAYTFGDTYATVTGNLVAEVSVGSANFTISDSGSDRQIVNDADLEDSAANASSSSGDDLHFAFLDTVNSKVLWVTDETTDQVITSGNPVTFPQLTYTAKQPTAV